MPYLLQYLELLIEDGFIFIINYEVKKVCLETNTCFLRSIIEVILKIEILPAVYTSLRNKVYSLLMYLDSHCLANLFRTTFTIAMANQENFNNSKDAKRLNSCHLPAL